MLTYATPTYYTDALQVVHHRGFRVLHENLRCPELLHRSQQVLLCPEIHHQALEYYITTYAAPANYNDRYYSVPRYYTEAQVYYTTKAVEYYTEAPKYYNATYTAPA
jgi:hypothetical protein